MEIRIKAYLNDIEVRGSRMSTWIYKYDGCRLDEIIIDAKLNHMGDCEELIEFLEIHKHCFSKP